MNNNIFFFTTSYKNLLGSVLLFILVSCQPHTTPPPTSDTTYHPSKVELEAIGQKIFENETGGDANKLIFWNANEAFPSLGLGHFIWLPEGYKNPSFGGGVFPQLIEYYKANGYKETQLPRLMQGSPTYAPWNTRDEMYAQLNTQNKDIIALRNFLEKTFPIQINFIVDRLDNSLPAMLHVASDPEHLKKQYERMLATPGGYYPLVDYVNFKGEGLAGSDIFLEATYLVDILGDKGERPFSLKISRVYQGYGWGLRQVLMEMNGSTTGQLALEEFSRSAETVLRRRVANAEKEGLNESIFLNGWIKRTNSYAQKLPF